MATNSSSSTPGHGGADVVTATPTAAAAADNVAEAVVSLPAPHDELLRTTTEVLSHFYPAAPPSAQSAFHVGSAAAEHSTTSVSTTAAATPSTDEDKQRREAATEALIEECSSPLAISPAPWHYMELPFLSVSDQMRAQAGGITSDDADEHTPLLTLVSLLVRLAVPVAATQMMRHGMSFVTAVFMGHYLPTEQFAAAATGLAFTNMSAMSIGSGFSSALDTLATQEHGRRKHSPEIAAIFLRSVVCTFVAYFPIAILYFFCDPFLALLIHPDLVADTAYFLRMSIFIAAPMMVVNSLLKFAQSQRVTQLGVVCSAAGLTALPPLLFLFRHGGLPGIIAALSINRFFTLSIVIVGVLRNSGLRQCWTGRSLADHIKAVLANGTALWDFTKVGIPILAANCADTWSFEILEIIAAHLGPISSVVWNIVRMIYSVLFGCFVGLASACAVRTGNAMGAGKGLLARHYSYALVVVAASVSTVMVVILCSFAGPIFHFIQSNDEVTRQGETMWWIMGVTFFVDSIFYALQGPFRGAGYNSVLLGILLASMWGVAVPLAMFFPLRMGYGVHGLMYGLAAGVSCGIPMQLGFLWCVLPWERRAHEASRPTGRA